MPHEEVGGILKTGGERCLCKEFAGSEIKQRCGGCRKVDSGLRWSLYKVREKHYTVFTLIQEAT